MRYNIKEITILQTEIETQSQLNYPRKKDTKEDYQSYRANIRRKIS